MSARWLRYLLHTAIWILFYTLPYLLSFKGQTDIHTLFEDSGDVTHVISFALLIAYSYFNYFLLIPRFYLQKKYLLYLLLLIACLVVVIKVPQFREHYTAAIRHYPGVPPNGPLPILFGMNYNIILFLVSTFVCLSIQHRQQLFQIEKEKLNAELSFLKAQINPHFLFNTLNSIYALAIEKSDDTPTAIVQLSELMRYILKDSGEAFVDLAKELAYLKNYIALQTRRLGDTVKIAYAAPKATTNKKVAPLILMSFVENAFKHGVNPDQDSEINISIGIKDNILTLVVINKKVTFVGQEEGVGIGLANTRLRLEHLYPGKYDLKIEDGEKSFSVILTMELA